MYQLEAIKRVVERFTDQASQGPDRPGHRHRQDPRRRLALRRPAAAPGGPSASCSSATAGSSASRPTTSSRSTCRASPAPTSRRPRRRTGTSGSTSPPIPAMMECFETFDVGFFDLIIADESHRSIYNRYRDLFAYFDCLQVGLTATPVDFIARNTYKIFGCEDRDPTAYFSLEEAISHRPPYLVPFEVITHTTPFLRKGIKYSEMSAGAAAAARGGRGRTRRRRVRAGRGRQGRLQQGHQPDHPPQPDGERHPRRHRTPGSASRSSSPATTTTPILLQNLFDEMYPQYGGKFCRVIDNYDARAEELIDDFKGVGKQPRADDRHLGGHARYRHRRARDRQPRLRQAGLFLRQVLADDRAGHPAPARTSSAPAGTRRTS